MGNTHGYTDMTYIDDNAGTTRDSVEWFQRFVARHKKFRPLELDADITRVRPVVITGTEDGVPCRVEISSCNCGYPGEGPRGTLGLLWCLSGKRFEYGDINWSGTDGDLVLENIITAYDHVRFYFARGSKDIEWDNFDGRGRRSLGVGLLVEGGGKR